jgi:hypothetical protein
MTFRKFTFLKILVDEANSKFDKAMEGTMDIDDMTPQLQRHGTNHQGSELRKRPVHYQNSRHVVRNGLSLGQWAKYEDSLWEFDKPKIRVNLRNDSRSVITYSRLSVEPSSDCPDTKQDTSNHVP